MDERLYRVYMLASRWRVLYIGVTGELLSRMNEHREGSVRGFTSRYRIQPSCPSGDVWGRLYGDQSREGNQSLPSLEEGRAN